MNNFSTVYPYHSWYLFIYLKINEFSLIGVYFNFLGHYTTWLCYASVMGFISWIDIAGDNGNPRWHVVYAFTLIHTYIHSYIVNSDHRCYITMDRHMYIRTYILYHVIIDMYVCYVFCYLYQDVCVCTVCPISNERSAAWQQFSLLTYIHNAIDTYVIICMHIYTYIHTYSAPIIPYLCVFVGVWCTLFLEFWKRKEKMTAMKWGMIGFEEEEQDRFRYATVCMYVCMCACVYVCMYVCMYVCVDGWITISIWNVWTACMQAWL